MKDKVNPRRRPATQADVNKARKEGQMFGAKLALALFFSCLRDKEGWGKVRIDRLWKEIDALADSFLKGYVSLDDLLKVLDENGYRLNL